MGLPVPPFSVMSAQNSKCGWSLTILSANVHYYVLTFVVLIHSYLESLLVELNRTQRNARSLKRFFRTKNVSDAIAGFKGRAQKIKEDFMVRLRHAYIPSLNDDVWPPDSRDDRFASRHCGPRG